MDSLDAGPRSPSQVLVEMEVGTPRLCDPICSFVLVSSKIGIRRLNDHQTKQWKSDRRGRWGLGGPGLGCAVAHLDPPVGPPLVWISDSADRTSLHARKLFCRSDSSGLLDCVGDRTPWTGKSARKRQDRPSRGIPTPPGYGYLTHRLP
jgi:hypothetical protein